jgi:hypothetical protein
VRDDPAHGQPSQRPSFFQPIAPIGVPYRRLDRVLTSQTIRGSYSGALSPMALQHTGGHGEAHVILKRITLMEEHRRGTRHQNGNRIRTLAPRE